MAETVLSMARSLVGSAVSKAASAAANEMSLLIGVQNEIWFIKDEMKTMQAFLRAAEVTKQKDELVKVWAEQVRDLAYDIEDCLEEFAVHVGRQSLSRQLMKLRHRHRIAVQIRSLKLRVEEVSNRNMRYNLIKPAPSSSMDDSASSVDAIRYQPAHYVDEAKLVGFAGPKKELLEMISSNNGLEVQVICVVGAGGLGKTTLAKRVYESSEISTNFACRAWITVSQSFHVKELLKDMIKQLLGPKSLEKLMEQCKGLAVHENHLVDHLREGLKKKRYFLILDDLWTIQAWDCIKPNFWGNNNEGSRVVVTTRNGDLVEGPNSSPYHLKTLEEDHAAQLLLRKVNRSLADIENNQMKEIFGKTLKKCGGLPLAIVTIGGLLTGKDVKEWEILYNQLPSELESNASLEAMRNVVALSYNHLPSHLKPCFLYLSIFPEDFEIKKGRLVDRWIAEGFVKARDGMTIKDVGGIYFDELINRSMIQPSRINIQGIVKSCRVHDIMRDITISISRRENFVYSIGDNETSVAKENFRHVTYHSSKCPNIGIDWSHVRSLTMFGESPNALLTSLCSSQLRMLRVLDLENAEFSITQKDINHISLLRHLKYLRFKEDSYIYSLPRSIGKLQGLQTLDMHGTYIATLPTEISKLHNLRSLRCSRRSYYLYFDLDDPKQCLTNTMCLPKILIPLVDPATRARRIAELHIATSSWSKTSGVKVPKGIGSLRELQMLEVVDIRRTSSKAIEELGKLSQLRKLSVETYGAAKKKHKIFCEAIQKLSSLQSLSVDAVGGFSITGTVTLRWMNSISSLPPLLRTLRLRGYLGKMPSWFGNLTRLVKLYLEFSELKEGEAMGILGALPNLRLLRLFGDAYVGGKLVFGAGAFPNLRKLVIATLLPLREVRFEEGASPQMERIEINGCKVESGIIGINHLPRLKEISLLYFVQVAKLGMLERELNEHPNHPVLRMTYDRSRHDLPDEVRPDEGSDVKVEATESLPEAAGESSQVVTLTTNDSKDAC